jgi:aldose 1-epimerase
MIDSQPASTPPSGRQHRLARGDHEVLVVEVGGGLRAYRVGGRDVLDGYAEDEMCSAGRGQALIPWPNRLRDGRYAFEGTEHQLALTEPERSNAIHGLVRWSSWTATEHDEDRVVMRHVLHPQPGYPFTLDLALDYALDDGGLTVRLTAINRGPRACPFGAGAHPYVTLGTPRIDALTLSAPGTRWLPADERQIPVGLEPVEGTSHDLRRRRPLGALALDAAFTDLERGGDGLARVIVEDPASGRRVTLWLDERYRHLMLFTGDELPEARRRRGLAIEPMTCAPNAFRSGDGLDVLQPGERFTAAWGISPEG